MFTKVVLGELCAGAYALGASHSQRQEFGHLHRILVTGPYGFLHLHRFIKVGITRAFPHFWIHHSNIGHIFISHHALNAEAAARVPWVYASRKYERPVLQFEWRHMTVLWLHAWILTRRMRASTNLADLALYSFVKLYMGRRGI